MAKVAALFPGQGSQKVGMGKDLCDRWKVASEVFSAADSALGSPLSELCWEGPEEQLTLTTNTQPALLAHSVAAWKVLASLGIEVAAVAGHSLGEYSAVVAAGGLDLAAALSTVRLRGRLMQEAVPVGEGTMAAVMGLDDDQVRAACEEEASASGEIVVAANFNAPGQVVIAGTTGAVERAGEGCRQRGARRVRAVPVSAPFHPPLMAPARSGLEPTLKELAFADLAVPLYRNVDTRPVQSAEEVRDGLIRQVDSPVLWSAIIGKLRDEGFDTLIEVGTGRVLSGLARRVDRKLNCYPAGTVDGILAIVAALEPGAKAELAGDDETGGNDGS